MSGLTYDEMKKVIISHYASKELIKHNAIFDNILHDLHAAWEVASKAEITRAYMMIKELTCQK